MRASLSAKPCGGTLDSFEQGDALDVRRLREHVDRADLHAASSPASASWAALGASVVGLQET